MTTPALLYLTATSLRNRLRLQAKRLRQPRYLLALIFGGAYIWFFLFRPQPGSPAAGPSLLGHDARALASLGLMLLVAGAWLFSSGRLALAFAPAEIDFLFPAPVTRRELVLYKLWRVQVLVLINTLLWVFLLKRGGSELPAAMRAVSVWALFTTLYVHRIGAALSRTSWIEHGRAGRARQRIAATVFAAALAAIGWSVARDVPALVSSGVHPLRAFVDALLTAPATWALAPLRWLVAPSFAHTGAEWAAAIWPVLLLLALNVVWVLRADVAFEQAAIDASRERVQRLRALRTRRSAPTAKRARLQNVIPLAPVGSASAAIVWKNTLAFVRTVQTGRLVGVVIWALAVSLAFAGDRPNATLLRQLAAIAGACMVTLVILGPRIVRNDLRLDLANLETMKTLPLRGRSIVLAEVASATLVVTALQLVAGLVAGAALLADDSPLPHFPASPWLLAFLPAALVAVNVVAFTLQNAAAVLVPGWVQTGSLVGGGVEVLGQSLLAAVASVLLIAIAWLPPALVGAAAWVGIEALRLPPGATIAAAALTALVVVSAEVWLAIAWLGRRFEKLEPRETL